MFSAGSEQLRISNALYYVYYYCLCYQYHAIFYTTTTFPSNPRTSHGRWGEIDVDMEISVLHVGHACITAHSVRSTLGTTTNNSIRARMGAMPNLSRHGGIQSTSSTTNKIPESTSGKRRVALQWHVLLVTWPMTPARDGLGFWNATDSATMSCGTAWRELTSGGTTHA